MLDPAIEVVLRGGLALLFGATAFEKARDFNGFRAALIGYALLPERLAGAIAALLASSEAALAIALGAPAALELRATALVASAALLALYGAAIAVNLARGRRDIECGCGGPASRQPLSEWLLARNALLLAAALVCRGGAASRPLVWVDALTVGGGIAVLAATWLAVHRLLANAPAIARLREEGT
ncbi:MAG: methylamine utilization MauE [Deltaproteobacteria bacterium]|nr:methylamine utilization MauE [Deltaproteobacteria bacterium]